MIRQDEMLGPDVIVPRELVHEDFVATPLTAELVALDHDAYVSSPDVIRTHSDGRWPVEGFTLDQDRREAADHQADHEARRAFTFVLLDPTRGRSLGCLYLNPLQEYLNRVGASRTLVRGLPGTSAMVTFWLRQDAQHLSEPVVAAVDTWLRVSWPLEVALFRALPTEHASLAAFEGLGLSRVVLELPEEARPYRWYRCSTRPRPSEASTAGH